LHLLLFRVRPFSCSLTRTARRFLSCSSEFLPYTKMSSDMLTTPFSPSRTVLMVFWNTSAALLIPKNSRLYLLRPTCVVNVVMLLLSSSSSNWLYPCFRSSFENTVAPCRSVASSFSVCVVGCRSLLWPCSPLSCRHIPFVMRLGLAWEHIRLETPSL
jgi:hypothetical protein